MNTPSSSAIDIPNDVLQQAEACFLQEAYDQASQLYEQAIEQNPEQVGLYWRLGLALVLQGREEEAQMVWMTPILEAEPEQAEQWTTELWQVLEAEADRQATCNANETAWLLRQHIRQLAPEDLSNLLQLLYLSLQVNLLNIEEENNLLTEAIARLAQGNATIHHPDLLFRITISLLDSYPEDEATLAFIEAYLPYLSTSKLVQQCIDLLLGWTIRCQDRSLYKVAIDLGRICVKLAPDNPKVLGSVIPLMQFGRSKHLLEAIKLAEQYQQVAVQLMDRIIATELLLANWMSGGGDWQRTEKIFKGLEELLQELTQSYNQNGTNIVSDHLSGIEQNQTPSTDPGFLTNLLAAGQQFLYFADVPATFRPLRNQLGQIAQTHIQSVLPEETTQYQQRIQNRKTRSSRTRLPKIGYLSASFQKHSVGWLCRWLLKHHDRDRFDIHLYSSRESRDFIQQGLIAEYGDHFHPVPSVIAEMANQIADDDIDILIELDSLTNFGGCGVVALKPAPIQVHWLGFDSSGIPAVDYFIADPYVLPEDADSYYSEKIWRLPQTYIAVDGFEVHIPSLRRDHLNIPSDAIVFLSSQTGMKRNPENARLQMQIIKEVPNSYFLVKSFRAYPEFTENFFREMAELEGVSFDRLRFLPTVPSEFTHRANLGLADVVLDTFPYNGATTTLEALWMGLPIVTRVGEQFAARNSYTMMMNVGVTEGLAWSSEEYLEWGIRLGTDTALRQDIFYRLQQSRRSAPLWNGRQFAREMENAYEQMWQRYCEG